MSKTATDAGRLVLGTVQLGLPYGVANATGQPDLEEAYAILKAAMDGGIIEFDTAQGYGDSEKVLGDCFRRLECTKTAKVVSKLDTEMDLNSETAIRSSLEASLTRLNVPALEGLLLHREEFLDDWDKGLNAISDKLVSQDLVRRIGVSVYTPEAAIRALKTDGISIVQIPTNIFDRRFENAGVFDLADELGKTLYIRSVFLQGLVFMTPETVPAKMRFASDTLSELSALANRWNVSLHALSLGYARAAFPGAKVLFGAETAAQVMENIAAWDTKLSEACINDVRLTFANVEERILNPVLWS